MPIRELSEDRRSKQIRRVYTYRWRRPINLNFLISILTFTSTLHCTTTTAMADKSTGRKKAIVVGAGVGGTATAARLAHAGLDVEVYEKNEFSGGRCSLIHHDGYRFDQVSPASFTLSSYSHLLLMLRCLRALDLHYISRTHRAWYWLPGPIAIPAPTVIPSTLHRSRNDTSWTYRSTSMSSELRDSLPWWREGYTEFRSGSIKGGGREMGRTRWGREIGCFPSVCSFLPSILLELH
jgi:hypothetical protein